MKKVNFTLIFLLILSSFVSAQVSAVGKSSRTTAGVSYVPKPTQSNHTSLADSSGNRKSMDSLWRTNDIVTSFSAPDTVCVNAPVSITNTSNGASSYYWNFCVANSSTNPDGINLGNFGFAKSVFVDYAKDGDYYAFVTNNIGGNLVRLDFGNSLLNTPIAHNLGNFGGVIPDLCEGIQVVKNEGKWYAIIVGGSPVGRIVKIEFGASLSNNAPTATNWGTIGSIAYPVDLHLFQNGSNWYGLTINANTSTITRFDFTTSFDNQPTGVNLGNIGGLSFPTGIYAISKGGQWYAFVTNAGGSLPNSLTASLTRLDFGSSLLNTPTGVNLGNPGNALRSSRDLTIYQSCNEIFGFVVNNSATSDIVRLNFNNSLTSIPSGVSLGNIGNFSFPHCISKLFRVENDLYSFVANVDNNTISRLKLSGCNGTTIPSSTVQHPNAVSYSVPGTYNINLTADDGLPTQSSFCRQVVVLPTVHRALQRFSICEGDSILLSSSFPSNNVWSNGSTTNSIQVKSSGMYWVRTVNAGGCANIDSFEVMVNPFPIVKLGNDTTLCMLDSLVLDAGNVGADFLWQNGQTTQKLIVRQAGHYFVKVSKNGCASADSVDIVVLPLPTPSIQGNTSICSGNKTDLLASGGKEYFWSPPSGLSSTTTALTIASPLITTNYFVTVTGSNGCKSKDSILVTVTPKPVFSAVSSKKILCLGDTATLMAFGGDVYQWKPAANLGSPNDSTTEAFPDSSTKYEVIIEDSTCGITDSLSIQLPVVPKPKVTITKSNDINCILGEATLHADGGGSFLWQPSTGISDTRTNQPVVRINSTTTYFLTVTTAEGCEIKDSITVNVVNGAGSSRFPVPTAFTPNNDGKNDCFGVQYWGAVSNFSMSLFNRWGNLVFYTSDPTQCWNGIYNGQRQPGDTYIYLIKAKTPCGDVSRKGTFTLIR